LRAQHEEGVHFSERGESLIVKKRVVVIVDEHLKKCFDQSKNKYIANSAFAIIT
jgi:hypothetical protein